MARYCHFLLVTISIFLLLPGTFCNCQNSTFRVQLPDGEIEGRLVITSKENEGIAFLGIPYAKPPIGNLRFRLPQPPSKWNGVLECQEYKPACWQIHTAMDGINYTGIEDCLYLNVFAGRQCLDNEKKAKCPVLYYIHGGGYDFDTPSAFPPEVLVDNFASKDIIMVTIQYRLNAFGFWTVGNEEANGNYGMHGKLF